MDNLLSGLVPVICGFAYGITSVVVGQPLETVKTQMQTLKEQSAVQTAKKLLKENGIRGLYRGGIPLVLGGGLIRSAQFGVYDNVYAILKKHETKHQLINPYVAIAGVCGGLCRGLVEGPFEYIKVRQQVSVEWKLKELFMGYGATMLRNSILFGSFVVYMDISKQYIPDMSPFWFGAINSSLAWITVWPMDVIKSRIQSGLYPNKSIGFILSDMLRNQPSHIFSGIVPGLIRSSLANGASMIVYKKIEVILKERLQ